MTQTEPLSLEELYEYCEDHDACGASQDWLGRLERIDGFTAQDAWRLCLDPMWLLWLVESTDYLDELDSKAVRTFLVKVLTEQMGSLSGALREYFRRWDEMMDPDAVEDAVHAVMRSGNENEIIALHERLEVLMTHCRQERYARLLPVISVYRTACVTGSWIALESTVEAIIRRHPATASWFALQLSNFLPWDKIEPYLREG